jgi:ribosome-associated protein
MRSALEGARKGAPATERVSDGTRAEPLLGHISAWLDEAKAEGVVTIDLKGKSSMADFMVVATGRSDRHVGAIAEQVQRKLKQQGVRTRIEGLEACDWVLVDAGDIIVHVFRHEVREFYKLERMWSADRPTDAPH